MTCVQQCRHSCNELGSRHSVRHGRSSGRLLDVTATFWFTGPWWPHTAQGSEVLAEDNVPLYARVSDAVVVCFVAAGDGRHRDTVGTVDDRRHAWEETKKYGDIFTALSSSILIL